MYKGNYYINNKIICIIISSELDKDSKQLLTNYLLDFTDEFLEKELLHFPQCQKEICYVKITEKIIHFLENKELSNLKQLEYNLHDLISESTDNFLLQYSCAKMIENIRKLYWELKRYENVNQ